MDETLKKLFSSSSPNSFQEDANFNVADALLWIAIGLCKIADAINQANEIGKKTRGEMSRAESTCNLY